MRRVAMAIALVACAHAHPATPTSQPVVYEHHSQVDFDDDVVTGDLTKPDGEYAETDRCTKALRQVRRLVEGTVAAPKIDGDKALARCVKSGNDEYFACVGAAQTLTDLETCELKAQIAFAGEDLRYLAEAEAQWRATVAQSQMEAPEEHRQRTDQCELALRMARRLVAGTPAEAKLGDQGLGRCVERATDEYLSCVTAAKDVPALSACEKPLHGVLFAPGDLP